MTANVFFWAVLSHNSALSIAISYTMTKTYTKHKKNISEAKIVLSISEQYSTYTRNDGCIVPDEPFL